MTEGFQGGSRLITIVLKIPKTKNFPRFPMLPGVPRLLEVLRFQNSKVPQVLEGAKESFVLSYDFYMSLNTLF